MRGHHLNHSVDFVVNLAYGVGGEAGQRCRLNYSVEECNVFGRVGKHHVAVNIVDGKQPVASGLKVAYGELSTVVGAGNAFKRNVGESSVVEVGVHTHQHFLLRLQGVRIEQNARNLERIDGIAC